MVSIWRLYVQQTLAECVYFTPVTPWGRALRVLWKAKHQDILQEAWQVSWANKSHDYWKLGYHR